MKIEEEIKQSLFKDGYTKAVVNLLFTQSYLVSRQSRIFKPHDISAEQYNVLRILRGRSPKPITVSSIQERMLNKMSNASRLVEKLKQKEMVKRTECPKDRRQVDVVITEKGLDLLALLDKEVKQFNMDTIHLDEGEVEQLNHLLDKLRG
ncbi:MarR family winged helix-turn-helix transcriptional regulator [Cyclobacterium marinum]|uniref:Regulatory protein MarR n=1 Tax=Cyclobacterium marinum (strain ATCC 25205 / DSM 745 / LMG 13164 / NCIMB 1802) TaxID=880070 RepID=G0IW65_CYCMS|nr:MarR family transcriptional regulator [Cyclobacterium marinum]AEL26285.1 regulatory protein MarR [Cyclobacterium marinum DSM 745]MBI0399628.1 MarR family transcriptional regulator [Cyclobacterium marinum]MBR9774355.1 MarR family transcriptional regulator [Cytophagales bacterium]|tara:strand:+ start:100026 stop:100475 length:450 start_codon:yes stop_codon:yes gene_type:complete